MCPLVDILLFIKLAMRGPFQSGGSVSFMHGKFSCSFPWEIQCLPFFFSFYDFWSLILRLYVYITSRFPFCFLSFCSACWIITLIWLYNSPIIMLYFILHIFQISKYSLLFSFSQYTILVLWMQNLLLFSQGYYVLVGFLLFLFTSIRLLFFCLFCYIFSRWVCFKSNVSTDSM